MAQLGCYRQLMNIAQQRQEMDLVVDGLTFKPVLKQPPRMVVVAVVINRIAQGRLFDHLRDTVDSLFDEQVGTVGYQTIGENTALSA